MTVKALQAFTAIWLVWSVLVIREVNGVGGFVYEAAKLWHTFRIVTFSGRD